MCDAQHALRLQRLLTASRASATRSPAVDCAAVSTNNNIFRAVISSALHPLRGANDEWLFRTKLFWALRYPHVWTGPLHTARHPPSVGGPFASVISRKRSGCRPNQQRESGKYGNDAARAGRSGLAENHHCLHVLHGSWAHDVTVAHVVPACCRLADGLQHQYSPIDTLLCMFPAAWSLEEALLCAMTDVSRTNLAGEDQEGGSSWSFAVRRPWLSWSSFLLAVLLALQKDAKNFAQPHNLPRQGDIKYPDLLSVWWTPLC